MKRLADPAAAALTNRTERRPIPNAVVEIVRADDDSVVAVGATTASGAFGIPIGGAFPSPSLYARVWSESALPYAEAGVADDSGFVHEARSATFRGSQGNVEILAAADDASGRVAGAFNIYAQIMHGIDFVRRVDPAAIFPPLTVIWERGVAAPAGLGCTCALHVHLDGGLLYVIVIEDLPRDSNDFDRARLTLAPSALTSGTAAPAPVCRMA
ncbi:MAG: hypothetical protein HY716_00215 [Planctomycetes bacterium]|nr:hypothetical protein [Planctomycetota bacterium]